MAGAQLIAPVEDIKHKRIQGVDDGTKQLKMVEYSNIPKAIKKETKNKAYFIRDLSKRFLENFNAYCILSFFSIIWISFRVWSFILDVWFNGVGQRRSFYHRFIDKYLVISTFAIIDAAINRDNKNLMTFFLSEKKAMLLEL